MQKKFDRFYEAKVQFGGSTRSVKRENYQIGMKLKDAISSQRSLPLSRDIVSEESQTAEYSSQSKVNLRQSLKKSINSQDLSGLSYNRNFNHRQATNRNAAIV